LRCCISIDYYTAIQNTILNYNPKCVSNIKEATLAINDLLQTDDGAKYVDEKFKYLIHNAQLILKWFL